MLVAYGTCACFGGVNRLKNAYDLPAAVREVYGNMPKETMPVVSIKELVPVDLSIPGLPGEQAEVERIVQHLVWGRSYHFPVYPVCVECKQRYTVCMVDRGQLCLGPITAPGCDAPCIPPEAWAVTVAAARPTMRTTRSLPDWRRPRGSTRGTSARRWPFRRLSRACHEDESETSTSTI